MKRRFFAFLTAVLLLCGAGLGEEAAVVRIDLAAERKPISPLIYGINNFSDPAVYRQVTARAVRQGGNRMTGYNWETNYSNAGSDWRHSSDTYLSSSVNPGQVALTFARLAQREGVPYRLSTLQLAGYVAADKAGDVGEDETAPSARWVKAEVTKDGPLSMTPDLTDGAVYLDEYVNFLVQTLGDSGSDGGIQAWSLDNEPALWSHTHPRIHPQPTGARELVEKGAAAAKAVKRLDPGAEIYGPAVYGMTAYEYLADENDPDWKQAQREKGYFWYLDYYLDGMRKASEAEGVRLLDVLDIHYYSESARVGFDDRLQAVRSLYEEGFVENSWIGQWRKNRLPILPKVIRSIETWYPGTKLGITEYNYGGEDISAVIAEAETLACFAEYGVYSAFLWGGNVWQYNAINLFTNYDGQGGAFGDLLVPSGTDDHSVCVACAAARSGDPAALTVMLTNKRDVPQEIRLVFSGPAPGFTQAEVRAIYGRNALIHPLAGAAVIENPATVTVTLPAYCAAMVILAAPNE